MNLTMKLSAAVLILLCTVGLALAAEDLSKPQDPTRGSKFTHQGVYVPDIYMPEHADPDFPRPSPEAMERWHDLKYGLIIHWGLYSIPGYTPSSWELSSKPLEWMGQYHDMARTFNPTDFDADEWMKMFQRNGIKCFTFTTKHHDGFSMYDTKTRIKKRFNFKSNATNKFEDCDYAHSIMDTPFKRDITREIVEAARRHGVSPGLYFSHIDWYDADFRFDNYNPLLDTSYGPQSDPEGIARFKKRYLQQVRELLTNYGPLTECFFDIGFPEQHWPVVKEMITMARQLQPDCLFSHRGIGAYGDYCTPEQEIPLAAMETDAYFPWEVAHSLHVKSFGYTPDTAGYRSGQWLVQTLIDVVAKGGNFMLGLGPDGSGKFHPKMIEAMDYTGNWLRVNGQAIFATRPWNVWHEGKHIRFTRSKDNKIIYAISLQWPGDTLALKSVLADENSQITLLGRSQPLAWRNDADLGLVINLPADLQDESQRPCKDAYAFKIHGKARELPPLHMAVKKPITLAHEPHASYCAQGAGTLLDGELSSGNRQAFLGFQGNDLLATIDLGATMELRAVAVSFLQDIAGGIYLPTNVTFELSDDGQSYQSLANVKNWVPVSTAGPLTKTLGKKVQGHGRFVRVHAVNIGVIPATLPSAGAQAWLFADEILVNP